MVNGSTNHSLVRFHVLKPLDDPGDPPGCMYGCSHPVEGEPLPYHHLSIGLVIEGFPHIDYCSNLQCQRDDTQRQRGRLSYTMNDRKNRKAEEKDRGEE